MTEGATTETDSYAHEKLDVASDSSHYVGAILDA